jgi:hypothetical protein
MEYGNEISFEDVVQQDPTLKFLIRDAEFDFENLEHQMNIRGAAIVLAISKWLELKYPSK